MIEIEALYADLVEKTDLRDILAGLLIDLFVNIIERKTRKSMDNVPPGVLADAYQNIFRFVDELIEDKIWELANDPLWEIYLK